MTRSSTGRSRGGACGVDRAPLFWRRRPTRPGAFKAPAAATDARAPPPPACAARLAPRLGCESQLLCQTNAPHRWAFPPSDYIGPDDHRETDDLARVSAGGNALQLNFVFGYTGRRVRQNLFYNADGRLVYHTAAVGVVYDKERHAQVSDPPPPRRTRPLLAVPRPRLAPWPPHYVCSFYIYLHLYTNMYMASLRTAHNEMCT